MQFCAPDKSGGIGQLATNLTRMHRVCAVKCRLNGEFNRNLLGGQKDDRILVCLIWLDLEVGQIQKALFVFVVIFGSFTYITFKICN